MSHVSLITLGVDALDRSSRFYEALGWERSSASADEIVFLRSETVVLALYGRDDLAADVGSALPAGSGAAAFATNLHTVEQVDELLSSAEAAGATVVKPATVTDWGGYSGYFADPDGHLWEVAHNPHFPLDEGGRLHLAVEDEEQPSPEEQIADFIATTDETCAGDPTATLTADIADIIEDAWHRIAERLDGLPNNKILATMLALGQRSREFEPTDGEFWRSSAASTLVSGMVPAGGGPEDG